MKFCSDDRAQSIQVGAVLLFGFLILALTLYQAQGVPEENRQVEFEHSQQVGNEMVDLYTAVFDTVVDGEPRTATITLGTEYNNRLFFIYPPPASGTLQTTADKPVRLHNVTSVTHPDTNQSFDNYWDNSTRTYTTQAITYSPNYRELRGTADYRIEYGMLAALYDESNVTELRLAENHHPIVTDDDETDGVADIDLVLIDGDLQSVDTDAESVIPERATESTEVTVTNGSHDGPITLKLPTELPADTWELGRNSSVFDDTEYVENVSVSDGNTTIQLNGTEEDGSPREYNLTVHKVDVGSGATEAEPRYLQNVSYDDPTLNFTVRDRFNDPVEEEVDVWVSNETGPIIKNSTSDSQIKSVNISVIDDPCGVVLNDEFGESYEQINVTGAC